MRLTEEETALQGKTYPPSGGEKQGGSGLGPRAPSRAGGGGATAPGSGTPHQNISRLGREIDGQLIRQSFEFLRIDRAGKVCQEVLLPRLTESEAIRSHGPP